MTDKARLAVLVGVLIILLVAAIVYYYPTMEGDPYSSDPKQRLAAIRSLAGNTDEESLKILRRLSDNDNRLSDNDNRRVTFAAVNAIAQSPESEPNRKVLLDVLSSSTSVVARSAAAAALGKCPGADLKLLTETMLTHPDPMVRAGAAKGLAKRPARAPRGSKTRRPDKEAVRARLKIILPPLVEALSDADPRVRKWAITAIKRNTAFRFAYDPDRPPGEQRDKIKVIDETLRKQFALE